MLKDKAVANRILGNEFEYSEEDIINASNLALLEINERGIMVLHHTIENAPKYVLLLGTSAYALSAQISLKSRNYMPMSDGGMNVIREGNLQAYQQIYSQLRTDYIDQLETYKGNCNLRSGF